LRIPYISNEKNLVKTKVTKEKKTGGKLPGEHLEKGRLWEKKRKKVRGGDDKEKPKNGHEGRGGGGGMWIPHRKSIKGRGEISLDDDYSVESS